MPDADADDDVFEQELCLALPPTYMTAVIQTTAAAGRGQKYWDAHFD